MVERFSREHLSRPLSVLQGAEFEFDGQLSVDADSSAFLSIVPDVCIEILDRTLEARVLSGVPILVGGRNLLNDRAVLDATLGVRDEELVIAHVKSATVYRNNDVYTISPITGEFEQ